MSKRPIEMRRDYERLREQALAISQILVDAKIPGLAGATLPYSVQFVVTRLEETKDELQHLENCGDKTCGECLTCLHRTINDLTRWKDALHDVGVVDWVLTEQNTDDPKQLITDIVVQNIKVAMDPAVSQEARRWQNQIDAGNRLREMLAPYAQVDSFPEAPSDTLLRLLEELTFRRQTMITPVTPNWFRYACNRLRALFG